MSRRSLFTLILMGALAGLTYAPVGLAIRVSIGQLAHTVMGDRP